MKYQKPFGVIITRLSNKKEYGFESPPSLYIKKKKKKDPLLPLIVKETKLTNNVLWSPQPCPFPHLPRGAMVVEKIEQYMNIVKLLNTMGLFRGL